MEAPLILLTTEGTYPCHTGGVSVWCDKLIRALPEFEFQILAITGSPSFQPVFNIPKNVIGTRLLPLWGTEEPGAEDPLFSETYRKKLRTTSKVIQESFLGPFETALRALLARGEQSAELARAMLELHNYFCVYDYARSVRSPDAWNIFLRVCSGMADQRLRLSLDDATCCMRWLQRYLAILSIDYPSADVVHASMSGFAGIPGVIQRLKRGSRFLMTEHGLYFREVYLSLGESNYSPGHKAFLLALNESVIRMNYLFADAVTSLCEFNRKWQIRLGADPEKIRIVPNGVDEAVFHGPRQEPRGDPVVLTMSRIMPLKGIDILLRAAPRVRQRVPRARFRILGEPAHKDYFQQCIHFIAERGLQQVIELDQTSDPASAYRAADVFCLPSISEAMPYSVIEAMFSGCPVVATDVGGVRELLGSTGVLVKPNDPKSLADGITDLLEGAAGLDKRKQLSATALLRAQTQFTLRQSIDRFRRLYTEFGGHTKGRYAVAEMPEPGPQRHRMVATG